MTNPVRGKDIRLRLGEGDNVVNFVGGTGGITINNTGNIQSDAFLGNDLLRRFGMGADYTLSFDRQIVARQQNILRFVEYLTRWKNYTAADMGELVVDMVLWGVPDVLWFRKIVKGPQTLSQPNRDLASVSGEISGEESWPGLAGTMETLTNTNLVPDDDAAVTWKPVRGQGGLVLLTYQREGDAALQLHTKRGQGAWTLRNQADAKLAADVSTPGSAVSLDAVTSVLQEDDLVRVRFGSGTAAGNTWSGRLAMCAPEDLG